MRAITWLVLCLLVVGGLGAACGGAGMGLGNFRAGEIWAERTVPGLRNDHAANTPEDGRPLHPAVYEYLLSRPQLPFLADPNDPAEVTRVRGAALAAAAAANTHLVADGTATLKTPRSSGGKEPYCVFLVSWPGRIVIARTFVKAGLGSSALDYGLDLAHVPEAFDPTAALTFEDVARRGRFLEELQ